MTKLSERIEAAEPGTDLTELRYLDVEIYAFVLGYEVRSLVSGEVRLMKDAGNLSDYTVSLFVGFIDPTPVSRNFTCTAEGIPKYTTDLNAIAALEREYHQPYRIFFEGSHVYVEHTSEAGQINAYGRAKTEPLARSAALVRALEVSRD